MWLLYKKKFGADSPGQVPGEVKPCVVVQGPEPGDVSAAGGGELGQDGQRDGQWLSGSQGVQGWAGGMGTYGGVRGQGVRDRQL